MGKDQYCWLLSRYLKSVLCLGILVPLLNFVGGLITTGYVSRFPEHVEKIALIAPAGIMKVFFLNFGSLNVENISSVSYLDHSSIW